MQKWVIKLVVTWLIEKLFSLIKSLLTPKEKEKGDEPEKDTVKPSKPPVKAPEPVPVPVIIPEPPKFDIGDFEVMRGNQFFAVLERHKELDVCIKHRDNELILINTSIGDKLYADEHFLQTLGNVRVSLVLNGHGRRYLNIKRNDVIVAGTHIKVL